MNKTLDFVLTVVAGGVLGFLVFGPNILPICLTSFVYAHYTGRLNP